MTKEQFDKAVELLKDFEEAKRLAYEFLESLKDKDTLLLCDAGHELKRLITQYKVDWFDKEHA